MWVEIELVIGGEKISQSPEQNWLQRILANPLVKSFIAYSIFRAFYGMGILIVTYFIATSENNPWWYSLVFLIFSMIFSRILFRWIKKRRTANNSNS
jgi:membrane protein implicated in regulation of membrane protease activity